MALFRSHVALFSPMLGAIIDYSGKQKVLSVAAMAVGVAGCGGMYFIQRGDLVLATLLFALAAIGAAACAS